MILARFCKKNSPTVTVKGTILKVQRYKALIFFGIPIISLTNYTEKIVKQIWVICVLYR